MWFIARLQYCNVSSISDLCTGHIAPSKMHKRQATWHIQRHIYVWINMKFSINTSYIVIQRSVNKCLVAMLLTWHCAEIMFAIALYGLVNKWQTICHCRIKRFIMMTNGVLCLFEGLPDTSAARHFGSKTLRQHCRNVRKTHRQCCRSVRTLRYTAEVSQDGSTAGFVWMVC